MHEAKDPATEIIQASREIIKEPFSKEKRTHMVFLINELIVHDFNALVQLLYRIDVDEKKLKKTLAENNSDDAASVIADLIIARQIQKAESRNVSRQDNNSDEEPW